MLQQQRVAGTGLPALPFLPTARLENTQVAENRAIFARFLEDTASIMDRKCGGKRLEKLKNGKMR